MTGDRPLLGILLMLGFCVVAPMGDSVAKILGGRVPLGELLTLRFVVQVLILVPLMWLGGRSIRLTSRLTRLIFLRTLLHIAGIGAMFSALRYLPLADAVAIAFVMPFIMLLLGKYYLGEEVGPRRLGACAVGFIGTLMVVQPSFTAVGAPALLPLAVAVIFALFMLVTRQIAKQVDPISLQYLSGLMASAILIPAMLIGTYFAAPVLSLVPPQGNDWMLFIALGAFGTIGHLLMTWSLRFAPSATVAPMQYLEIPFATLIGLVVFSDFPNGLALAGIIVTMAAGLYVIQRERVSAAAT